MNDCNTKYDDSFERPSDETFMKWIESAEAIRKKRICVAIFVLSAVIFLLKLLQKTK